jgi:hypothetical protein
MFLNPTERERRQMRPASVRRGFWLMPLLACVGLCLRQPFCAADDGGLLGDLAKPTDGRSMRASSTFREGADGKYDSKAFPKGDTEEKSNYDNFRVDPGKTHVLMDVKSVRLRERRPRVTDYGFDKNKDWKQKPDLYR